MILNNKRGMSSILVPLLFVILVIGAIVILWSYFSATISSTSEQIALESQCLLVNLEPIKCSYVNYSTEFGYFYYAKALIMQTQGSPADKIVALLFDDGTTETRFAEAKPIYQTQEVRIVERTEESKEPKKITVVPIVFREGNKENFTCSLYKDVDCLNNLDAGDGDLCDDLMVPGDIVEFVNALNGICPDCDCISADFDCDGDVNYEDIDNFVHVLGYHQVNCNRAIFCGDSDENGIRDECEDL